MADAASRVRPGRRRRCNRGGARDPSRIARALASVGAEFGRGRRRRVLSKWLGALITGEDTQVTAIEECFELTLRWVLLARQERLYTLNSEVALWPHRAVTLPAELAPWLFDPLVGVARPNAGVGLGLGPLHHP